MARLIIWKKVKTRGFKDRYLISNYGDILSLRSQRLLVPHKLANGGLVIGLSKNNKSRNIMVHKLVWGHFKRHEIGTNLILHKDFNRENNYSPNLKKVKRGDYLRLWNEHKNKIRGVYKHVANRQTSKGLIVDIRWRAVIKVKDKVKTIGYYKTEKEAIKGFYEGYLRIYKRPPFQHELIK